MILGTVTETEVMRYESHNMSNTHVYRTYCDVRLESLNLCIRRAELREARSHGNKIHRYYEF
jgi:hypothetical protein